MTPNRSFTVRQIRNAKRYLRMAGFIDADAFVENFIKYYWINCSPVTAQEFDPENVVLGFINDDLTNEAFSLSDIMLHMSRMIPNNFDEWIENDYNFFKEMVMKRNAFFYMWSAEYMYIDYHSPLHGRSAYQEINLAYGNMRSRVPTKLRKISGICKHVSFGDILTMKSISHKDAPGQHVGYVRDYNDSYCGKINLSQPTDLDRVINYMIARDHLIILNTMSKKDIPKKMKTMTFLAYSMRNKILPELAEIVIDYMFI